jgi:hypothetical protein
LLANIFSFVIQNLTQHVHRTSLPFGKIYDFSFIEEDMLAEVNMVMDGWAKQKKIHQIKQS